MQDTVVVVRLCHFSSAAGKNNNKKKKVSTMEEGTVWEKASRGLLGELTRG